MKTINNLICPAFALFAFACFAFSPAVEAVSPPPDGGYANANTAEGQNALLSLDTTTGANNTAVGFASLGLLTTGSLNTGVGTGALLFNTADANTATGAAALLFNTSGTDNTATGAFALYNNIDGNQNSALGDSALFSNIHASGNTAVGDLALTNNDSTGANFGINNTAVGAGALSSNTDGDSNNAVGFSALAANTDGLFNQAFGAAALGSSVHASANIAIGDSALTNYTGAMINGFNTVIGDLAGYDLTDGIDDIYIGATAGAGVTSENGTIRIGDTAHVFTCFIAGISGVPISGDPVLVNANGQLGVPTLGSPLSASELLKECQVVQELKATTEKQAVRIALQEERIALQEGQIQTLTAALKQQAEQIQKVSAQLELNKAAPQTVGNSQ